LSDIWPMDVSKNKQLPFAHLLRRSLYSRLAGYGDLNDATRLAKDPIFRLIGSKKIWERGTALTSRLQSFETTLLTQTDGCLELPIPQIKLARRHPRGTSCVPTGS
jgi:hypothetical protein